MIPMLWNFHLCQQTLVSSLNIFNEACLQQNHVESRKIIRYYIFRRFVTHSKQSVRSCLKADHNKSLSIHHPKSFQILLHMNYAIELASSKKQRIEYSENRIYKCDINPKIKRTNLTILCPGTDLKTKITRGTKYTTFLVPICTVATVLKRCASGVWCYLNAHVQYLSLITCVN